MLAIQCIGSRTLRAAGGADDAGWRTIDPEIACDTSDPASMAEAVAWLEMESDGSRQYRVVDLATVEESYAELEAENLDALEAMGAWVTAGCPRGGEELMALERAAVAVQAAAPVKTAAATKKGRAA